MATARKTLYKKITLLTLLRLIMAMVLLVTVLIFDLRRGYTFFGGPARELVYSSIMGLLLLCTVSAALLERVRSERAMHRLVYSLLIGDALFATVLVLLTGGADSVFTFLYSLAVINAALLLYRRGAIFSALVNSACLVLIGLGQTGHLGDGLAEGLSTGNLLGDSPGVVPEFSALATNLVINVLAFFGIALLSSFLAEQIRQADQLARRHKEGFEELANLHEHIVSSLENGLITITRSGEIGYINRTTSELLQVPAEDLLSKSLGQLFPQLPEFIDEADLYQTSHLETQHDLPDGSKAFFRWSISPLRNKDNDQIGHILLFFDITRVKEMEARMARTERLAAMGRLAANIAHEIRNPLASLSGSIQLLAETTEVEGPSRRLMDIVVRETEHLNSWITEFLDFTRPRALTLESVDLFELVDEVIQMLTHDERMEGVHFEVDGPKPCQAMLDRNRVRQVIWNLVVNAGQAVGSGGNVQISVERYERSVELTVEDDGPGIPPEAINRIFEPFFTTKAGGTGLGLATVYRNVEDHGGSIHVESLPERDHGTVFKMLLPSNLEETEPTEFQA